MRIVWLGAVVAALPLAALAEGYVGQQTRDIKALSSEEVADLLAGRGMGMAKPAELNHFPGPAHVLELKEQLGLTPAQVNAAEASFSRMRTDAQALGAELVERERALDRRFAAGGITEETVRSEAASIGTLQGRLRAVHLAAHLEMRALLSPAQVARYDTLRGYGGGAEAPQPHRHRHGG